MPRKPGYFVKGRFVAQGSELDCALQAERRGTPAASRSELKRASNALQALGKDLLGLPAERLPALGLPADLLQALAEAGRITDFEGRRRQLQYVGKIMRRLDPAQVEAAHQALAAQHAGQAGDARQLQHTEQWRERLLANDQALAAWLAAHPASDSQQLRTLIRQARSNAPPHGNAASAQGLAARKGRAYRELFRLLRAQLADSQAGSGDAGAAGDTGAGSINREDGNARQHWQ